MSQRHEHSLILSDENRNMAQRWNFQHKIESALIALDSKVAARLKMIHMIFTDPDGIEHDYFLEILDETPKRSL